MIFDCHTHLAERRHVGGEFLADAKRAWGPDYRMACAVEEHIEAMRQCDGAIVVALDARDCGYYVPNSFVADYVARMPTRLFGFASVNPNRPDAARLLEEAIGEYRLRGLKLAPIYQNFDPSDRAHHSLYRTAQTLALTVLWHQGTSYVQNGPLELSNPILLDPVARSFPDLRMIIAHLGHPWIAETCCILRKHRNVYADVSALNTRPWQMYNALLCAVEYGVQDKLLFGTDFPFFDCDGTAAVLRRVNDLAAGTNLPRVPERIIEEIIHRDTPGILALA